MEEKRVLESFNAYKLEWLRDSMWFFIMAAVIIVLFRFIIGISVIEGDSMEPTLSNGNLVVYFRPAANYHVGDIVSVRVPSGKYYIKRIAAAGDSTVEIYGGKLHVDGEESDDPHAYGETVREAGAVVYPYEVRKGNYFLLGDNREASVDSRYFGEVGNIQIKGRIILSVSGDGIRSYLD